MAPERACRNPLVECEPNLRHTRVPDRYNPLCRADERVRVREKECFRFLIEADREGPMAAQFVAQHCLSRDVAEHMLWRDEIFARINDAHAGSEPAVNVQRIADGRMSIAPMDTGWYPSQNANDVHHIGVGGLASEEIIDEIIASYCDAGVSRFFFYLSPSLQRRAIEGWLKSRGMSRAITMPMLSRGTESVPDVPTKLRVRRVDASDRVTVEPYLKQVEDDHRAAVHTEILGHDGFATFVAFDRDTPVADSLVSVFGGIGYLGHARTLESHRNQGAQSAMIAARIGYAQEQDCRRVISETYRFAKPSYTNLVRCGFEEAFVRPIYRWERQPS